MSQRKQNTGSRFLGKEAWDGAVAKMLSHQSSSAYIALLCEGSGVHLANMNLRELFRTVVTSLEDFRSQSKAKVYKCES